MTEQADIKLVKDALSMVQEFQAMAQSTGAPIKATIEATLDEIGVFCDAQMEHYLGRAESYEKTGHAYLAADAKKLALKFRRWAMTLGVVCGILTQPTGQE